VGGGATFGAALQAGRSDAAPYPFVASNALRVGNAQELTMHKASTLLAVLLTALSMGVNAIDDRPVIYISASRAPEPSVDTAAAIQVIDRETIAESGTDNIPDLLRGRAGIHVVDLFGDGSNATIDMRGFGSSANSNVLVMLDGRRLNPSTDAASLYLNDIPLHQVERIEVIQGSAGVLFGNQAVGGVINIITRRPQPGTQAEVNLSAGSYARREAYASLSHAAANGFGLRLDARALDSDNYRDHNDLHSRSANLLLDYESDGTRVFFEQRYLHDEQQTPGALFLDELDDDRRQSAPIYADDFIDTRSDVSRIGIGHRFNASWRFDIEAAYRDDEREFLQSSRVAFGPPPIALQDRRVVTVTPRFSGRVPFNGDDIRLTIGADYEQTDYSLDALILQEADQRISAAYAQAIVPLAGGVDLSIGGRHARVRNDIDHDIGGFAPAALDLDDSVTVGSLGLTWRPDAQWRWFARLDQNYRFAKLEEHTQDLAAGAFPFVPIGIDNQTGVSIEAGVEHSNRNGTFMLQLYQLQLNDEITFDASNFANINLDQTTRNGLTLLVQRQLNRELSVGLDLDLIDGEVDSGPYDGNRIPLVPQHQVRLFGQWTPLPDWQFGAELLYVGDQVLDSDYDNAFRKLDAYTTVRLSGSYAFGPWEFNARVDNLFDRAYSEYGVVGQDTLGSGHPECVSGLFSDSCPAFNPSPERRFWLSAAYRFDG
jgi:iron complex outermembrane receptor protein